MSFHSHFHTLHQRQLAKRSGGLEIQLSRESKLLIGAHQKRLHAAHLLTAPNADILIMPPGFPLFHSTLTSSPRPNSIDAFSLPWRQTALYSDFYFYYFLAVKLWASYSTFLSLFIVRNEPKVVSSEGCCKD